MQYLLEEIRLAQNDNLSGSGQVLEKLTNAFEGFLVRNEQISDGDRMVLSGVLEDLERNLGQFSVVRHFVHTFSKGLQEAPAKGTTQYLEALLVNYRQQYATVNSRMAVQAMQHIAFSGKKVVLHSNSSALVTVFEALHNQGIKAKVVQTESRPVMEGRRQAATIADLGFDVHLIADAAISEAVQHADLVLLGADVVLHNHFVNKLGSLTLALACQYWQKPIYVLADQRKFVDMPLNDWPTEKPKPTSELWPNLPVNVSVNNLYFEAVPLALISAVITDQKVAHINHS